METLITSPLFLSIAGGLAVLLLFVFFQIRKKQQNQNDPLYLRQVRQFVTEGRYEEAAQLQLKQGHKQEALNLLERGKVYSEATYLAEELGFLERAAQHAEKAGDFKRAAKLYAQMGEHEKACQLYAREGLFAHAAEALEQTPGADIQRLAQLWEQALLQMFHQLGGVHQLNPHQLQEAKTIASKSALFYEKVGNLTRAAQMYDIAQQHDKAQHLRIQIQANPVAATLMGAPSSPIDLGPHAMSVMQNTTPHPAYRLPTGASVTPPFAGGYTGFSQDALTAVSQMVHSAVQQAVQSHPKQATQVVLQDHQVKDLLKDKNVQVNVVHIPDATTGHSTTLQRETDRYKIGEKLGEGGMAVVYEAVDRVLERRVALKFLPEGVTQAAQILTYFQREAKAAAALNHPNIITIYDYGLMGGRPFICMELLQGATLEKLLQRTAGQGLPLLSIFEIAEGLLQALDFAHSHQFVHRDIKPANVMYTEQRVIKLMDFGIARQGDASQQTIIAGTPLYMAPEQMLGRGVDHRTDLFAVGVTFYELLTCLPPYEGMARNGPPPPPSHIRPMPEKLERAILWCLQLDPMKRPQSAYDLLQTMRSIRRELERDPRYASELRPEGFNPTPPRQTPGALQTVQGIGVGRETVASPLQGAKATVYPQHTLLSTQAFEAEPAPHAPELEQYASRSNDSLDQLLAVYLDNDGKS